MWVILTSCADLLAYSLSVYNHTEAWRSTKSIKLQFAPPGKVVMKDDNWGETFGQFTVVHFSDLNKSSYDISNMKFDLNVSTVAKCIVNALVWKPG